MSVPTFRLFVSSPGDVAIERRRIATVVSRINGECAGRARIDVIRWETETYQAFATFQAQIPRSVECDLVVTLFKWRLGTELPPSFPERLPTGEPYPSGTAYELLTAMDHRRAGAETPDVFVYRYAGSSPRPALDDPDREGIERNWQRLNAFFERWFLTPEGHFLAAFQAYGSEDDLEAQVEALLRRWLADKVAAGRILAWPDAIKGSPFPGLEAYGRRHAAVFFGRDRDIARAAELWQDAAGNGTPFLLVVGASGAGKSSLVRAGLAPRITIPGVVPEVDLWRVAVMRPGDRSDGPVASLVAALLARALDLPASEEGRGPALPELAVRDAGEGRALDPDRIAALFASDPERAAARLVATLDGIGADDQAREKRLRTVRVDLVLVVDQLDEIFAPTLREADRDVFVALLAALVATRRVWIAATLRADLYGVMLDHQGLKRLKEEGASYDLAPPGPAELAEIVRRPTQAADLTFGQDPQTQETLDERLLREADRPDMLPLVQLALARLYEGRHQEDGRTILPFAVYAGLGGLKGIIDEVGERALAGLAQDAVRTLPRLVRKLAQLESEGALAGTLTLTPVRLADVPADDPQRGLIDALVAARLLNLTDAGDGTLVRLAHQRVLTDWTRTHEIVAGSADFYRIRQEIDRRRQRWEANRRADLLLPRGLPLAEAETMLARYGDEIAPASRNFVKASRRRAGRAQMVTGAAAVLFALVAVGAVLQTITAREQTALAERNFGVAREAVRDVVFNIVQGLKDVSGMRIGALRQILSTVQNASNRLNETSPDDPELLRARGAMFENFARLYLDAGDVAAGRSNAETAVAIMRRLVAMRPEDIRVEGDLAIPLVTLGDSSWQGGDLPSAIRFYEEALANARQGAARAPQDATIRQRVISPLGQLGDARDRAGDEQGAQAAYDELLATLRRETAADPKNSDLRAKLATAIFAVGYLAIERGDLDAAEKFYQDGAQISRDLAAAYPTNIGAQRSLSVALTNLGQLAIKRGRSNEAIADLDAAVAIERDLTRRDPDNPDRRRTLAIVLEKRGNGAYELSDWAAALTAYAENLKIARDLSAQGPQDLRYLRSVGVGLQLIASVKRATGEIAESDGLQQERLDVSRQVAARQPESAEAMSDLSLALRDAAESRHALQDKPAALGLYDEAATVSRRVLALDRSNLRVLRSHADILILYTSAFDLDDPARSLPVYRETAETLQSVIDLRPKDARSRRLLALTLVQGGTILALNDDRAAGLAMVGNGVAQFRALLPDEPSRTDEFVGLLNRYALVASYAGEADLGRLVLRDVVDIRRRQSGERQGAAGRIALATALVALAQATPEPEPLFREAAGLLDGLAADEQTDGSRTLQQDIAQRLPGAAAR